MADNNQLGHVLRGEPQVADRLGATGIHFLRSGENVGYNSDFNDITHAWMQSPGHRENMLSPNYNVVGIGVAQGDDGIYYATQDFAFGVAQRTPAQAEDMAADAFNDLRKKESRRPLQRLDNPQVHNLACNMAKTGKLDPRLALQLPNVREALVYNNARPEELPNNARNIARHNNYQEFAVGACFTGDQPNNPGGTFFVVMTFD